MSWGFERGRIYNRRIDIHGRFGGQQQGGIITPSAFKLVVIITGDEGLAHGYADRLRPDGAFEYFGEGQLGDMTMQRGNAAIASHSKNGASLLLFRKMKAGLRFEGEYVYEKHHTEPAPDRMGSMRDAIVFELRPVESVIEAIEDLAPASANLELLRLKAFAAANPAPSKSTSITSVFERSQDVRDYVVARAIGKCEGCASPAPFLRKNGIPYLEPHHIRRLTDGGPDDPRFVIALCPNCHRRVHSGADGTEYNGDLLKKMKAIEIY